MSQDLRQALHFKTCLYAAGGKAVPERVKMYAFQPAAFRAASYPILQSAGLRIPLFLPGQHIGIRVQRLPFPAELCHLSVQRNDADGGAALGYPTSKSLFFCLLRFLASFGALCLFPRSLGFLHVLASPHFPYSSASACSGGRRVSDEKEEMSDQRRAQISPDSQACQQSQQHAEPAAVHILQQIFCKTALFFRGEDPHLLPVFPWDK